MVAVPSGNYLFPVAPCRTAAPVIKNTGQRRGGAMSEGPFPQVADASVFTHRRSTVNVGNPALILHRAYQIPAGEIDAQWREAIVEFATKVQANLCRISRTETSRESFNPATLDSLRHCTFRAELNHSAKSRVGISFSIDILDVETRR